MNDDALLDLFNISSEAGYTGNIVDFHYLLRDNQNALNDVYGLAKQNGYDKDIESFKTLLGVEKPLKRHVEDKFLLSLPEHMKTHEVDSIQTGTSQSTLTLEDELEVADKNREAVQNTLDGQPELTPGQSRINSWNNMWTQLSGWDNRMKKVYYASIGDLTSMQAEDLELSRLDAKILPVIEPDEAFESFDDGVDLSDFDKLAATTVNALTGLGVSFIERQVGGAVGAGVGAAGGFVTGGPTGAAAGARLGYEVGGLAGIASDMIASSIIDYNTEKAKEMGVSYEELVQNGDADILAPAMVGLLQAKLESFGLKSIAKGIKGMAPGGKKFFADLLKVGTENGFQELGQEIATLTNEETARLQAKYEAGEDIDISEYSEEVVDNVLGNQRRLFNAMMNGVLGGKGSVVGGRIITGGAKYAGNNLPKLVTMLRTEEQYNEQQDILDNLNEIENEKNGPNVTPEQLESLDAVQQAELDRMRDIQNENLDVVERMEEQEVDRAVEIYEELNKISNNIKIIENTDRDLATKRRYIAPLQKKIGDLTTELSTLRDEAKKRPEPVKAQVAVAPFYEREISSIGEANDVRQAADYQVYVETINDAARVTGIKIDGIDQAIGGYYMEKLGKPIIEVSNVVNVEAENLDQVEEFAALLGGLTPEVQESTIASEEVQWESERHNADVYSVSVSDSQATLDALKKLGITDFTLNEEQNVLTLFDIHEFRDEEIDQKFESLLNELEQNNVNYETKEIRAADSRYIGEKERQQVLQNVRERAAKAGPEGQVLRNKVEQALAGKAGAAVELTQEQREVNEIRELQGKPPKYSTEQTEQEISYDIDQMVSEMNSMPAEVLQFEKPSNLTTEAETNTDLILDRSPETNIIQDIKEYNGVPMTFTISDELATGTFDGQTYEGGSGFNSVYTDLAWANTTEAKGNESIQRAVQTYQENIPLFERLWEQGKIPYGHVPMAVIKMSDDGLLNNEALYRKSAELVEKSVPKRNRVRAYKELLKLTKDNTKVNEFVKKYKTIDQVMANITELPLTTRKAIGGLLFTGNINEDTVPGAAQKPVAKGLIDGLSPDLRNVIHARTIRNLIAEPSTAAIPQRHVISLVAVDVLNPEVRKIDHKNYPYGIKGTSIGILKKPIHAMDLFPEMMAKAISLKGGRETFANKTIDQLIQSSVMANGPVAGFYGYRGIKIADKISEMRTLMSQLKLTFPDVSVVDTQQEFTAKIAEPSVKKYVKKGDVVYGLTVEENGKPKIYINPDYANTKVLLHEYSHVWQDYVRENNPELLQAGYNLLEGTDALKKAILENGDTQLAREEAMAELIANKGETIVQASLKSRFKNWLNGVFNYIKSKFKAFTQMSSEDFQNITLDDFVNGALVSMFEGDAKKMKEVGSIKFSKQNIKDLMLELVKRKYSQQAIKEALEEDYDAKDIVDTYIEIRNEYQKQEYKNEGLFNPKQNIFSKTLDVIYRNLLSSRGYLAKSQQQELEKMDGAVQASVKQAQVTSNKLVNLVKKSKLKGEELETLSQQINMVVSGQEAKLNQQDKVYVTEEMKDVALDMRAHIDVLQKQLLDGGYLQTQGQREAVEKGLGNYITRSYRIFDAKDWTAELQARKDGQQIIQQAKNFLRTTDKLQKEAQALSENSIMDYNQALDMVVDKSINAILSKSDANPFIKSSREGAKETNALKRRKEIPEPIMRLMGVYEDPLQNYQRTIFRVSSLLASSKYLETVRKRGMNVFLFDKNDPAIPDGFTTEIAPATTDSYSPLSGLITTPEIAEAIKREPLLNGKIFNSPAYRYYVQGVAGVKYAKTILSIGTHGKNITGNLFFMAQNGYMNPKAYQKAWNEVMGQIKLRGEVELSSSLEKYINLGIIDKSVARRELMEMFGKDKDIDVTSLLERKQMRFWHMHKKNWYKSIGGAAEKAYQLEDDYFKIVSFEMEKKRYAESLFKKPFKVLTEQQQQEVEGLAAENTKNIIPNYGRIGQLREIMRVIPLFGTFISFQMESYRTAYNTIQLALKESRTPGLKAVGAKRLASIIAFQTFYHYVVSNFVGDIIGATPDDDESEKYARLVRPTWAKNSKNVIVKAGDGKFSYIDMSASNPHGQIDRAINAIFNNQDPGQAAFEFFDEALGDFTAKDILYGSLVSVLKNEKPTGGTIWKEEDSFGTKLGKAAQTIWKSFEPGTVRSAIKIAQADDKLMETIGQSTGYKVQEVDYSKSMFFTARKILDGTRNITSQTTLKRRLKNDEITREEYNTALNKSDEAKREAYADLVDLYRGGLYFGMSHAEVRKQLKAAGVPGYIIDQAKRGKITRVRQ